MTAEQETVSPPAPEAERRRPPARTIGVVVGLVIGTSAALGALGGWLWYLWWGPPNTGVIYDTAAWGPRWLDLSDQGLAHQFAGPAEYTVIALGFGIVLGIVAALVGRRQALVALAALIVGSALAAYLSWAVGTLLSPPDPQQFATKANACREEPCKEYDAAIEVGGWTPFLVWPIGALGAFCATTVAVSGAVRADRSEQSPPS